MFIKQSSLSYSVRYRKQHQCKCQFKCAGMGARIMLEKTCEKNSRGKRSKTTDRKPKTTNSKTKQNNGTKDKHLQNSYLEKELVLRTSSKPDQ